ncbi:unnamed protein product, partial [Staurois parvus]
MSTTGSTYGHCWAALTDGTDGRNCWAALMGSSDGWHCWALMGSTDNQCPDYQCRSAL